MRWLRAALLLCAAGLAPAAFAQVTVNQILFPVNIGRAMTATVAIDYTRSGPLADTITVTLPPQVGVNPPAPPAGCTVAGSTMQCAVPAGATGTSGLVAFDVRGVALGSFSLTAQSTGGASSAANTGTVRSSAEVAVIKVKSPAASALSAGQTTTFTLQPQIVAGDDLPAGAVLTIVDQLPGTASDFIVTAISPGIASCSSVADANNNAIRRVTCTITGPRTIAELNTASIVVTGYPGTTGTFTNVGSIAADQTLYFDRNLDNNAVNVDYSVEPGGDVQALGHFPSAAVGAGSAQTLTLDWRNNGPMTLPPGGTVYTTIPAGFTVTSLPAGCTGPALNTVLVAPAQVTCTAASGAANTTQSFAIGLTMPANAVSGNFTVTVTSPAGYADVNAGNNQVNVPYVVVAPFADLRAGKTKVPSGGPIAAGTQVTTTLSITNSGTSTNAAVYGPGELRVVDYMRPEEIAGDAIVPGSVTAGWNCVVDVATDPADATRTRRVTCARTAGGSLAIGATDSVSFKTVVGSLPAGALSLTDRACTGQTALTLLGLPATAGPQPDDQGRTANDCTSVALTATTLNAAANIVKESSVDGLTWVDATTPTNALPVLAADAGTAFWRIRITIPASQDVIPTLRLRDTLPGFFVATSPGGLAPSYATRAAIVTNVSPAGNATGACPAALTAPSHALACDFTNVQPGTSITVTVRVDRALDPGTLQNTATLSSPDALLSGTLSDAAAITVLPRTDIAATTKTITPTEPRVGQFVQFTVTGQNLGPDAIADGSTFEIVDDLRTQPTATEVGYTDITALAPAGNMSCTVSADTPSAGFARVRCVGTNPITRYSVRTITIRARVIKPLSMPSSDPPYPNQVNTASVRLAAALCEYKTETVSGSAVSGSCNDAAAASNNTVSKSFAVRLPLIDLQQRKTRVLPAGQSAFTFGQNLRYRFRLQNNGPSRAENVQMVDEFSVPAGFTLTAVLASGRPSDVNNVPAESGYTLVNGARAAALQCTQSAANQPLVCRMGAGAASYLDAGEEINFEVEITPIGTATGPLLFRDEALVCADESTSYEVSGSCSRSALNNNNLASVNELIFPRTDLTITKSTVTVGPVTINQPIQYALVLRNLGPSAIQQMRVSDVLPAGFEFLPAGAQAPTVVRADGGGAAVSCTAEPASLTVATAQQTVTCVVDALPGPLGSGTFPGTGANVTLQLWARAKEGVFAGPYLNDRTNTATISPGLDGAGRPLALDLGPEPNSASSVVQVSTSSLAGRVFIDVDGNGTQEFLPGDDEGIGNVTVTLTGTDAYGNAVTRTTTTSNTAGVARGAYLFSDLPPGSYTVTETQPSGFANSTGMPPAASAGGSYAAAPTATTSRWTMVALPANTAATGYLFPEAPPLNSVSGHVFVDRNDNALHDAGDTPIAGVVIGIYPGGTVCPATGTLPGGALQTVTTSATGWYQFTGLTAGSAYTVCEQQPVGYADRPSLPGTGGTLPPIRANQIDIPSLPVAGSLNNDFPEALGSISGTVFRDFRPAAPALYNNGVQDAGEPGIGSATALAGVPITLTGVPSIGPGAGAPMTPITVYTAADGSYRFDGVLPGVYTVSEGAIPAALGIYRDGINTAGAVTSGARGAAGAVGDNAIRGITLVGGGASSTGNNFAELPMSFIAGVVFVDENRNGVLDGNEPGIGNVVIELRQGGTSCRNALLVGSVRTTADGGWMFPGGTVAPPLTQGLPYRVCEVQPADFEDGPTLPGNDALYAAPNDIFVPNLPVTGSIRNNFGEVRPMADIAGVVFVDADRDGAFTRADTQRIVSVTLELYEGETCIGTPIARVLTAADGSYRFFNLTPGRTYSVCQTQPAGYADGPTLPGAGNSTPAANHIRVVALPDAGSLDNHFGERPVPAVPTPDVVVAKASVEPRFVAGNPGHYTITVRNVGTAPTLGAYTVADRLPAGLTLAAVPTGSGWTCTGVVGAATFRCESTLVLAPGATHPGTITFTVAVASAAQQSSPAVNAVLVEGGGEAASAQPTAEERARFDGSAPALPLCTNPASQNACRTDTPVVPGAALSGSVWLDDGTPRQRDATDRPLPGWIVELIDPNSGAVVRTQPTGADGGYRFTDLIPGMPYVVRFRDPDSGVVYGWPVNGEHGTPVAPCSSTAVPSSCEGGRQSPTLTVVLAPGQELVQQSLPVSANVVYDSVTREPIPGATVTLTPTGSCPAWNPATQVAGAGLGGYTVQGGSISMTTGRNGLYQFLLLDGAPARCTCRITVAPPASHVFVSDLIPPSASTLVVPAGTVRVQPQAPAPTAPVGAGTNYHLVVEYGSGTGTWVHNHIPLDPWVAGAIALSKTSDRAVVEVGDTVRYAITVRVTSGSAPRQVSVADTLPAGFTYVPGTATVGGQPIADPAGAPGPRLVFQLGGLPQGGSATLQYRVRVGVGAAAGDGVNRAIAYGCARLGSCLQPDGLTPVARSSASNEGRARVRVQGGVFGTDACVLGKVFVDCNGNHVQDREELGIPGVRLVLSDGTTLVSDSEGKFSMCGLPPKSHVLRIDELTLPRGSRLTTSSNRNLGDAGSLWLDLKLGELQRADFIEGSCSNTVLDQVKARRAQGEVRAPETEKAGRKPLRFDSKAHGRTPLAAPAEATDGANQRAPKARPTDGAPAAAATDERHTPTSELPMNRPPPRGRTPSESPDAANDAGGQP